jgi:hypothetical protein
MKKYNVTQETLELYPSLAHSIRIATWSELLDEWCRPHRCSECSYGPWEVTDVKDGVEFGWCNFYNIRQMHPGRAQKKVEPGLKPITTGSTSTVHAGETEKPPSIGGRFNNCSGPLD